MLSYQQAMDVLHGSKRYEFNETELTITGYYSGDEVRIDFENMTEEMYEKMSGSSDIPYDDAIWMLKGSKRYKFEETELTITDYHSGDEISLDLSLMTEEMYEELSCEELNNDMEDFSDAVNALNSYTAHRTDLFV